MKSLSLCAVVHQSRYSCKQCTDAYPNSRTTPKTHTRSRSYTRSLTSSQVTDKAMFLLGLFSIISFPCSCIQLLALRHPVPQLGETLNRQFESVCETMFGEVESQAVEALDLPGVFRTRSHSYVRAIQAGCSQDDDCLSVFSMSGPQGSIKGGARESRLCVCLPPTRWQLSRSHSRVTACAWQHCLRQKATLFSEARAQRGRTASVKPHATSALNFDADFYFLSFFWVLSSIRLYDVTFFQPNSAAAVCIAARCTLPYIRSLSYLSDDFAFCTI